MDVSNESKVVSDFLKCYKMLFYSLDELLTAVYHSCRFRKGTTIGKAVKQVLIQAMEQERVHFGIFGCVDILDRYVAKCVYQM